jgi:hypothetical protein
VTDRGALNGSARFLLGPSDVVPVGGIVAFGGGKSRSRYPAMWKVDVIDEGQWCCLKLDMDRADQGKTHRAIM